jgi:hypothetical protein
VDGSVGGGTVGGGTVVGVVVGGASVVVVVGAVVVVDGSVGRSVVATAEVDVVSLVRREPSSPSGQTSHPTATTSTRPAVIRGASRRSIRDHGGAPSPLGGGPTPDQV